MKTNETKPGETKIQVAMVGPCSKGPAFRVHAAGCRDIAKDRAAYHADKPWTIEVSNAREIAAAVYGPEAGSFYEEAGGGAIVGSLETYLDSLVGVEVHLAPCCAKIPAKPETDAERFARTGRAPAGEIEHDGSEAECDECLAVRKVVAIAGDVLGLETLETRLSDSLDFHNLSVWEIRKALLAAYAAGAKSVRS